MIKASIIRSIILGTLLASASAPVLALSEPDRFAENHGEPIELSLEDAILLARERSFRTGRSERSERIADLRYQNARAGYLPRAELRASIDQSARGFVYESDRFEIREPTQGEFRGGVSASISVPIDLFGVIRRQVRQAGLQRDSSQLEVGQALLDVTLEVQSNYLNALRAQTAVDADAQLVGRIEALLQESQSSSPSVVPFLEVELGNAQQSLTTSRTFADQAQDSLRQTLRLPPDTQLRLTSRMTEASKTYDRGGLLKRALAARPDVQQALNRVAQARISQQQITDYRKPSVSVTGFYSDSFAARTAFGDLDRFSSHGAGLNVSIPLLQWDNAVLGRQKEIARLQTEQALADEVETKERVAYELRQALLAVERAESRIRTAPNPVFALQALERAEQSLLTAPNEEAQAMLAQVSNARNVWRSAMTASADAHIDYNNAIFRLERTLGGMDAAVAISDDQMP